MRTISLICVAGPHKGQTYRLSGGPVFIFGRYSKATFSLFADPAASHLHFLVDISENRVRVTDLGSTNGLVINEKHYGGKQGKPFHDFVTIKSGDTVLAGSCLFRLSVLEEATIDNFSSLLDPKKGAPPDQGEKPTQGNLTAVIAKIGPLTESAATIAVDGEEAPGPQAEPAMELPEIRGYTILERIGGGGKGIIYKAIKDDTGASAAIKMLLMNRGKSKKQRSIEMFRREIQMTRQLQHPNIIRYLGDGMANGSPYLAIEYVAGGNLEELIHNAPEGRLELPQAVPLFIQLLEAVAYMHGKSMVHRDIKPHNVLLDLRRGGSLAVKLSDMGLSCRISAREVSEFLPIISEGGTPAYMPPEQLTDLTRAIPQSDIFSSAATFYHMLTGALLYDFTDKEENEAIIAGDIKPIQELRPDLPDSVAEVVCRALSYAPEDRYANAQEMLEAFAGALA